MGEVNYAPLIDDMVWSYSRIKAFEDCPYRWYLKYIKKFHGKDMFFSSYGSAKIARNASTIAMISDKTPEEIEADGAECGNKKLRVTVNRNGMQMTQDEYIDLLFDGNHILYEQAKQHIPQTPF